MINYVDMLNKKVRVITMIMFQNGRKIKTDYIGVLTKEDGFALTIKELDGNEARIPKKHIKRIEEIL